MKKRPSRAAPCFLMKGNEIMEKLIRCPECIEPNTPKDWDEATQKVFGPTSSPVDDSVGIPDLWFICPACNEQVDGDELEVELVEEVDFEKVEGNGFITDSTDEIGKIAERLMSGNGSCVTTDLLTAQALETILLINNITYVKNVYFNDGVRIFDFEV